MIFEDYLLRQNTHWQGKPFQAGTRREALNRVISFLPLDQTIAITGIRRCGKSFLLKQTINHLLQQKTDPASILFVNLDAPPFTGKPAHEILDPIYETFLKLKQPRGRQFLLLDEVQNLPQWENWIKYQYDQNKGGLKFILTGSNSQMLSSELASRSTGRVVELALFPFSFREYLQYHDNLPLDRQVFLQQRPAIMHLLDLYLQYGGMPELLTVEESEARRALLISYFDAILYKDIIPRFSVREQGLLNDLAVLLVGASAEIVNLSRLATRFRTTRNTLREYIDYLEKAFLLSLLQKFSFSHQTRLDSFKKCFALDTGMANLLPILFSPDRGKLLETLVCTELRRRHDHVFYYRDKNECDFLVQDRAGEMQGIQVCYRLGKDNLAREIAGLTETKTNFQTGSSLLLVYEQESELTGTSELTIQPVAEWLTLTG